MSTEMKMLQMGSAIIHPYWWISREEMITPTEPNVSAITCNSTPAASVRRACGKKGCASFAALTVEHKAAALLLVCRLVAAAGPVLVRMVVVVLFRVTVAVAVAVPAPAVPVAVGVLKRKHANQIDQEAANRNRHQAVGVHVRRVEETLHMPRTGAVRFRPPNRRAMPWGGGWPTSIASFSTKMAMKTSERPFTKPPSTSARWYLKGPRVRAAISSVQARASP
jgi:hypothetical protein